MSELSGYFGQALLVQLNKQIIESSKYFPEDGFAVRIQNASKPPIPDNLLTDVMKLLKEGDFITTIENEIAGNFVKLNYARIHDVVIANVNDKIGFIYQYSQVGEALLQRMMEKLSEDSEQLDQQIPTTADPFEEVPASDRIVSRTDNLEAIQKIEADVEQLRTVIQQDNEVGAEIGDAREIIDLELEIAKEVLKKPRFRLKSLLNWLLPSLSFLADKFAGGAIAEAAKRLVTLLLSLM